MMHLQVALNGYHAMNFFSQHPDVLIKVLPSGVHTHDTFRLWNDDK